MRVRRIFVYQGNLDLDCNYAIAQNGRALMIWTAVAFLGGRMTEWETLNIIISMHREYRVALWNN